ncbi:MAG: 4Fe-4S binding protein [Nitrospirae bacterium]|nr:4Fe-4S binding protein [Nitrospirota bacterium]
MKKHRILIGLIAVLSLGVGYILSPEKAVDERIFLRDLAPEIQFSEKKGSPLLYSSDAGIVAFNSHDIAPEIRGYAGPVKLLVAMDSSGRITGLRILEHRETKNYVQYMETSQYLSQFIGKSVHDPIEVGNDIDGISRATVSVNALAKTAGDASRIVASQAFGIAVQTKERASGSAAWLWYLLTFLAALGSYFATLRSKKLLRLRDITMAAGIVVIGLYLSTPFSVLHVFNLALLRPSASLLWYLIMASTALSVVLAGRFYCGWLCPFGALSEFIARLPFRKWGMSHKMDDRWRNAKYIFFGLAMLAVFLGRRSDFGNYETYVTLFSFSGNYLAWTLVGLSLAANLRVERFWCRYLCPVAALTGLLCRKTVGYRSRQDCPMANKPDPLIAECIRCNRCYTGTGETT